MSDYRYIGKDGKTVLARDLEDERDALRARLAEVEAERDLAVAQNDRLWAANYRLVSTADAETERADAAEARAERAEAALATARRDAWERAAQMVEDHFPATQDMQSTMICVALEDVAAAIRALIAQEEPAT